MADNTEDILSKDLREIFGVISADNFVAMFAICHRTARRWRREGTGPRYIQVGTHFFYRLSDIQEWLDNQASGQTSDQISSDEPAEELEFA